MGRNSKLTPQEELKDNRVPCSKEPIEVAVVGYSTNNKEKKIEVANSKEVSLLVPEEILRGSIKAYHDGEEQQPENHDR